MENKEIEIYIIAYNNLFCVEYQIKTFKSFCQDPHKIIIIDSNCGEHPENSRRQGEICSKYGVEFLAIPDNLRYEANPTRILAAKLNWVYYNIVKQREPKYFAFIDQDFFPFKKFSVIDQLDQYGMYGDVNEMDGHKTDSHQLEDVKPGPWHIHPWLSFYRYDLIKDYPMDWSSAPNFDTGGKNWDNFISRSGLDKKNYWRRHKTIMYFPFMEISGGGPAGYEKHYFPWRGNQIYGQVQIYDGKFIHMLNSKYLDDPSNPKTNWCKGFLDLAILMDGTLPFNSDFGFYNEGPADHI